VIRLVNSADSVPSAHTRWHHAHRLEEAEEAIRLDTCLQRRLGRRLGMPAMASGRPMPGHRLPSVYAEFAPPGFRRHQFPGLAVTTLRPEDWHRSAFLLSRRRAFLAAFFGTAHVGLFFLDRPFDDIDDNCANCEPDRPPVGMHHRIDNKGNRTAVLEKLIRTHSSS